MKRRDFGNFNILEFLDEYGVSFRKTGKNIANGWIGVETCPFCSAGGFHFGINLAANTGSCWVCGESANAFKIVEVLADLNYKECWEVINKFSSDTIDWVPETDKVGQSVIFPDGIDKQLSKAAKKYLLRKNYNPDHLVEQFKIKSTDAYSTLYIEEKEWDFSARILIPVYMYRKIQCYVARDFTDKSETRYMNSPVVASIREPKSCIYNFDTLKGKIILMEGTSDVWRFGSKCGGMLGVKFTTKQVRSLYDRKIEEVTVLFDEGADKRAKDLAHALTGIIPKVKIAYISEDDPGKMDQEEALKTKYQLIGEI